MIFKSEKGVNGLTTAASVWAVAAIGMATANGLYAVSALTCLAMIIVLVAFNPIEQWIDKLNKERTYRIVTPFNPEIIARFESIMRECKLDFRNSKRMRVEKTYTLCGRSGDREIPVTNFPKEYSVTKQSPSLNSDKKKTP